jgi:KDO2-lipid IV(A) lauroyltransferase
MLFIIKIISSLPLKVLYKIADALFFIMYKAFGYRKKVVRNNLKKAFPAASETEWRNIEREFYRNFCDFIAESLKGLKIAPEELRERVVFTNLKEFEKLTKHKGSVLMLAGHQFNWEWMQLSASLQFPIPLDYIYHPLHNKSFDNLMLELRGRFGAGPIKRREAARQIIRRNAEARGFCIVADQLPAGRDKKRWVSFLNSETAFFYSIEQLAKITNLPVAYFNIRKIQRGKYEVQMHIISTEPRAEDEGVIIKKYAKALEENIKQQPENWLWSHKRWKLAAPG